MKHKNLFSLALLTTVAMMSTGCSQPLQPFDVKGTWQAEKQPCWDVCRFVVRDHVNPQRPEQLHIVFPDAIGDGQKDHVFEPSTIPGKEDEWAFPFTHGTGYLYLEGQSFKAQSGITYKKINEVTK